ncbi:histidine phosphotransferase family protein [Paracoccus sphaerophysae]|uniref:histidine phosphotransferase family protein n=1 Tax=Paracoccus sphaerophysae TaxID=690417 RepID=UPI002355FEC1|nr:histidine phosphotransferase family protein [Paracoccus sphaerophysae]
MTAVTMPNGRPQPARDEAELASLVAARLCHDLVSPLGAIGNGVELLEMSGDFPGISKSPELALITESVRAARARVRFFRTAFGHASPDQRVAVSEIGQLMADFTAGGRLTVELDGSGDVSRPEARMILLALMCMDSAMPWGGRVLVCRTGNGWRLVGEASRTRFEPASWSWLDHRPEAPPQMPVAAEVHFAMLGVLAARNDRPIAWEVDASGGEITF